MKNIAIIAAGGRGQRMGKATCKQFLALKGRAILAITINQFQQCPQIDGIIIGITPGEEEYLKNVILHSLPRKKIIGFVTGGKERQITVTHCLKQLPESCEIVLVHDGVRPLVSISLIEKVVKAAVSEGAVIPATPAEETTKKLRGRIIEKTLDRSKICFAQTPQGFKKELLLKAYRYAAEKKVLATDDASLVEALGENVYVISGEKKNIKITTPGDLALASFFLEQEGR